MLLRVGSAEVGGLIEVVEFVPERDLAWAAVEALTERKVVSFLSDNDIEAETAIEVFILDSPLELDGDD